MRLVLAFLPVAMLLCSTPVFADQIDVIFKFASVAEARADPIVGRQLTADRAHSISVWRESAGGRSNLPGYYVLVSMSRALPALRNHPAVALVINRDKANARQAGSIIRSTISATELHELRFSPVFAGADYPFGAWPVSVNPNDVSVGAIRWDAWYHPAGSLVRQAVEATLGPAQYQYRAPFCAEPTGSDTISIACGQDDVDREILLAAKSGLRYWAFVWYSPTDHMQQAWRYFQASPYAEKMNWCLLFSNTLNFLAQARRIDETIGYFRQANYQTVLGGRPLIYLLYGGGGYGGVASTLAALRAAAIASGLPNPYVVVLSWAPETAAAGMTGMGADAIGAYAHAAPPRDGSYALLDTQTREFWETLVATGHPIVPLGMTGWDRRPRVDHPPYWEQPPSEGIKNYYTTPTPDELTVHLRALVDWTSNNPSAPAGTALVYAWNEHDEGGWINPTLGQNEGRIDAFSAVLQSDPR